MIIGHGIHDKTLIGSAAFFTGMPGYGPHDTDYLILVDQPVMFKDSMQIRGLGDNKKDLLYWRSMSKEEFIRVTLQRDFPMEAGKFLVPEFCKVIHFTVDDLDRLSPLFDHIDDKHLYETVIRDAYKENRSFILTEEQLRHAYELYRAYR
jgi:hypothetical protein